MPQAFALLVLIAFTLLQIGDVWTTVCVIRTGGRETNPIISFAIRTLGLVPGLLVAKALELAVVVAWVVEDRRTALIVIAIACPVYAFVVFRNWRAIRA